MRSNYNKMDGELYFPGISYQKLAGNQEEFVVQPQVIIKKVDGAGVHRIKKSSYFWNWWNNEIPGIYLESVFSTFEEGEYTALQAEFGSTVEKIIWFDKFQESKVCRVINIETSVRRLHEKPFREYRDSIYYRFLTISATGSLAYVKIPEDAHALAMSCYMHRELMRSPIRRKT